MPQHPQQQRQPPQFLRDDDDPRDGGHHQPYPDHDPYQTPRLYGQNPGQGQGQMPPVAPPTGMGTRAKKTMPIARRAISEQTQFQTRDNCWHCNGTGHLDMALSSCSHRDCHGRTFTAEEMAKHVSHDWRGDRLPCGHDLKKYHTTSYGEANCPTCEQSPWIGKLERYVSFEQFFHYVLNSPMFMNALFDALENVYPRITDPATAEQRAIYAQHAQDQEAYRRSEPTAPSAYIGPAAKPPEHF